MRHEEVSQILLSSQFAHDLGHGQCGKNTLGLQTQRQEIGEHFDQQSGVQTGAWSLHRAELDNRLHDLPETRNHMMLLPNMPDFCTPERSLTKIHSLRAVWGAFAKKEPHQCSTGGTRAPDATRWHVNAPWGFFSHQDCFPCRRIPLLRVNRQDIVAFACHDAIDTSQLMQPGSECLRDIGRVHGQWKLREVNPCTKQCRFALCQHAYEYIGLGWMIPTLF